MKFRGIHIRGLETIDDISLDFRDSKSRTSDLIGLVGGNGSGKSLIAEMMSMGWGASLQDRCLPYRLRADFCRLDFEHDNEMLSIHIRGDQVDASSKLAALFDVNSSRHMVLKYDYNRLNKLPIWAKKRGRHSSGVNVLWPMLSDLHTKDVRDSIIIIDDFELGLDAKGKMDLFRYMRRHHGSKGNQVIMMMREKIEKADGLWIGLEGRIDPIELAMQRFSEDKS